MAFLAAYGEVDLKPPLGGSMPGYFSDRKATGFIDPIQAKCVVLCDAAHMNDMVAILALDLVALGRKEADKCREAISRATGIKSQNIWIHATHTHTGPMVPRFFTTDVENIYPGFYPGVVDADFMARLVKNVAEVVKSTKSQLKQTEMIVGQERVSSAAMYR